MCYYIWQRATVTVTCESLLTLTAHPFFGTLQGKPLVIKKNNEEISWLKYFNAYNAYDVIKRKRWTDHNKLNRISIHLFNINLKQSRSTWTMKKCLEPTVVMPAVTLFFILFVAFTVCWRMIAKVVDLCTSPSFLVRPCWRPFVLVARRQGVSPS